MEQKLKQKISALLNKSDNKLKSAKLLFENGQIDDSISRAYYSMYHSAQAALLMEGIVIDSHSGLKRMFGLHLVKKGKIDKKYSQYLNEAKDEREMSDYDVFVELSEEDAEELIKNAEGFNREIKRYIKKYRDILTPIGGFQEGTVPNASDTYYDLDESEKIREMVAYFNERISCFRKVA